MLQSKFNAREFAIQAIVKSFETAEPLPLILDNIFKTAKKNMEKNMANVDFSYFNQNKAFCTELVYAYLRLGGILELGLNKLVKKPKSLPLDCQISICLGFYELFLHKANSKSHATVFEYVEYIKKKYGKKFSALVNGVLRNALREHENFITLFQNALSKFFDLKHLNQKSLKVMCDYAKLPSFFVYNTQSDLLRELLLTSINVPNPSYRINLKNQHDFLSRFINTNLEKLGYTIYAEHCLYIEKNKEQKESKQIISMFEADGLLTQQGISSQVFGQIISKFICKNSNEEQSFWDACCGRGGKSLALLERGHKILLCSDPNQGRLNDFQKNMERLKLVTEKPQLLNLSLQNTVNLLERKNFSANNRLFFKKEPRNIILKHKKNMQNSPLNFIKNCSQFKYILLDSPCSTSGTIGRNPEVKHRISQKGLEHIKKVQKELLHKAFSCLKNNGYMIYCTCSVFQEENEGQIKKFLQNHKATLIEQDYIIPQKLSQNFLGHDILFYAILQKN